MKRLKIKTIGIRQDTGEPNYATSFVQLDSAGRVKFRPSDVVEFRDDAEAALILQRLPHVVELTEDEPTTTWGTAPATAPEVEFAPARTHRKVS